MPGAPAGLDVEGGQFSLVAEGRTVFLAAAYPTRTVRVYRRAPLLVPARTLQPKSRHGPGPFRPGQLVASSPSDLVLTCFGPWHGRPSPRGVHLPRRGPQLQRLPTPSLIGQGAEVAMAGPTTLLLGTYGAGGDVAGACSLAGQLVVDAFRAPRRGCRANRPGLRRPAPRCLRLLPRPVRVRLLRAVRGTGGAGLPDQTMAAPAGRPSTYPPEFGAAPWHWRNFSARPGAAQAVF